MSEISIRISTEACSNIAFIKYWGNTNHELNIPSSGSISMNLKELTSKTTIEILSDSEKDQFWLDGNKQDDQSLSRVSAFLKMFRENYTNLPPIKITSQNNFPMGTGLASSASGFAALASGLNTISGLNLSKKDLSILARKGSGSACRSIPSGFVEWHTGNNDKASYAESIAAPDHWDLVDCMVILQTTHKEISSKEGHHFAETSPYQPCRIDTAKKRLETCRQAIQVKDFEKLAYVIELDSNMMHAVMLTSNPSLIYLYPESLQLIKLIPQWRKKGIAVCFTLDAGPNVHIICEKKSLEALQEKLAQLEFAKNIILSSPGDGTRILNL